MCLPMGTHCFAYSHLPTAARVPRPCPHRPQVDHPHIVRLHQCFDTPKTCYLVMELSASGVRTSSLCRAAAPASCTHTHAPFDIVAAVTGGELFDRIVEKSKYSEAEAAAVVRSIADALVYCHSRGIVHRDLKPENLLYSDRSDDAVIKIADFGLAKVSGVRT